MQNVHLLEWNQNGKNKNKQNLFNEFFIYLKRVLSNEEREEKYGSRRKRFRKNRNKFLTKEGKLLIEDIAHALYQSRVWVIRSFSTSDMSEYTKKIIVMVILLFVLFLVIRYECLDKKQIGRMSNKNERTNRIIFHFRTYPLNFPSPSILFANTSNPQSDNTNVQSPNNEKPPNPSANFLIVPIQRLVLFARMLKDFDLFLPDRLNIKDLDLVKYLQENMQHFYVNIWIGVMELNKQKIFIQNFYLKLFIFVH